MKRAIVVVTVLLLASLAWGAGADSRKPGGIRPGLFEAGINLGEPTGLSVKWWLDRTSALEGIAAWAFTQGEIALSLDYLFNFPDLVTIKTESFPVFVGIGGIVRFGTAPGLGLRVPVGVLYAFRDVPLEISLEVVPGVNLFPDTSFLAMGGIGVRFCF